MEVIAITAAEVQKLLDLNEDHFNDVKSSRISPAKLQESFVAFANSDGGDLYIGIEDNAVQGERVSGFKVQEDANAIISTLLEATNPAVENLTVEFLDTGDKGLILHLGIPKSPKVHYTASGDCYIRVNAQKSKIKGERVTQLGYSKGAELYERKTVDDLEIEEVIESPHLKHYMQRVNSNLDPKTFLRKQRLLTKKNEQRIPNVGCVLLFDEEPQATLQTRCAIKVYRLRTTENNYKREQLEEMPVTINGTAEELITQAIAQVAKYIDGASYNDGKKIIKLQYPAEHLRKFLLTQLYTATTA